MATVSGGPPRLALMGLDREAAGWVRDPELESRRILGVVRRLAPAAEAMLLSEPDRVEVLMVLPASLDAETIWHEVLFATVRNVGISLEQHDIERLGVAVGGSTMAIRRLFRVAAGLTEPRRPIAETMQVVRSSRSAAMEFGTMGPVLHKSARMALELASHIHLTVDEGDDESAEQLVESLVLAWGRWHHVMPKGDRVAELHRLVVGQSWSRLGEALGRRPEELRTLDEVSLRQLVHDQASSERSTADA